MESELSCDMEYALCAVWLERYFVRLRSVTMFWPAYLDVTDSAVIPSILYDTIEHKATNLHFL
jgi:hypothetical protein